LEESSASSGDPSTSSDSEGEDLPEFLGQKILMNDDVVVCCD